LGAPNHSTFQVAMSRVRSVPTSMICACVRDGNQSRDRTSMKAASTRALDATMDLLEISVQPETSDPVVAAVCHVHDPLERGHALRLAELQRAIPGATEGNHDRNV
jgi:hypothetical protein